MHSTAKNTITVFFVVFETLNTYWKSVWKRRSTCHVAWKRICEIINTFIILDTFCMMTMASISGACANICWREPLSQSASFWTFVFNESIFSRSLLISLFISVCFSLLSVIIKFISVEEALLSCCTGCCWNVWSPSKAAWVAWGD